MIKFFFKYDTMRDMEKKLKLLTYGCQMNVADSERMAGLLKKIGYSMTDDPDAADLILINTCCVRATAEDKVFGQIGRFKTLKRQKPSLILGVAGCMAQKEGTWSSIVAAQRTFVLPTSINAEPAGNFCARRSKKISRISSARRLSALKSSPPADFIE